MSHPSKTARNGKENLRLIFDERCLQFRREHQVSVTHFLRSKARELSAADAEIREAGMQSFFNAREAQRNSFKICRVHRLSSL